MGKNISLTHLVSIRTLEKIQENFSTATGISCVIRDIEGNQITKMSNPNALWETAKKNEKALQAGQKKLLKAYKKCLKSGQTEIIQRYMDCYAFVVPIYNRGKVVAFFIGGLVRYGNPNINLCTEESAKIGVDIDTILAMYWALPLVNEKKLIACANLLRIIAATVSSVAKEGSDAKEKIIEMAEINQFLEKKIIQSGEKYQNLFNTINYGVYITNKEGNLKDINEIGAKLLGYKPKELIGMNVRDLYVNPLDRKKFLEKLYKNGHIELFQAFIRTKQGKTKHFETNATVMKDHDGTITGVQGIFRDMDDRIHKRINYDASQLARKKPSNYQGAPQKA